MSATVPNSILCSVYAWFQETLVATVPLLHSLLYSPTISAHMTDSYPHCFPFSPLSKPDLILSAPELPLLSPRPPVPPHPILRSSPAGQTHGQSRSGCCWSLRRSSRWGRRLPPSRIARPRFGAAGRSATLIVLVVRDGTTLRAYAPGAIAPAP